MCVCVYLYMFVVIMYIYAYMYIYYIYIFYYLTFKLLLCSSFAEIFAVRFSLDDIYQFLTCI